ncbi:MAG: SDR family oxidoreductase [Nitrososphaerota archaeon]|jgi:dTDP-4-dehydrorhamnose reductase|nr:SDR family oxidoreductase [Nitrososphaerota archaeon]MDG6933024.1 SDR family oxidoreductase [Nitrososphaerota archaeon]MDG6935534.1 SDR family oxidoreductase [Nitrososphaerota archaeon]MDG6944250.1 SDR family oxidoreductase [Nitrososphaerota archaeon]
MKVLLTGAGGLLGKRIIETFRDHEIIGVYNTSKPETSKFIKSDLSRLDLGFIVDESPDVIIHAAAMTDVDRCEENPELAKLINYEVTKVIAKAAGKAKSFLVYISTDYIFDGERGNYREDDEPKPVNVYGMTKLMGEDAVKELEDYLIVRTSTPYGSNRASGKDNFAQWIIKKINAKEETEIVMDQITSPTFNTNFALMLRESIEKGTRGTINLAGRSKLSRYEFAIKLAEKFQLDVSLIKPIIMDKMKWKAKRPRDISLNVEKALNLLNEKPLSIDEGLKRLGEEFVQIHKNEDA